MMRLAASDGLRLAIVCEQRGTLARNLEVGGEQEARKGGKKKTKEEGKKQKTKRCVWYSMEHVLVLVYSFSKLHYSSTCVHVTRYM